MRTFKLRHSVSYDEFMKNWSLTKLPRNIQFIKQNGYTKGNGIYKYLAFDKNGKLIDMAGGNTIRQAITATLLKLNQIYFYAHMINGLGNDEKCLYIRSLYNK